MKEKEIILNIYKQMYLEATPSVNFEDVSKKEGFNYSNYFLEQKRQEEIIEEHLKNKRLTKPKKQMICNTVHLNLAPNTKENEINL